jgi:hypothetical protein
MNTRAIDGFKTTYQIWYAYWQTLLRKWYISGREENYYGMIR